MSALSHMHTAPCTCSDTVSNAAPLSTLSVQRYLNVLHTGLTHIDEDAVVRLAQCLRTAWRNNKHVFICGNGGSAANANHLANDLLYGAGRQCGRGIKVTALPANSAVLTCLANDISYADIYAEQLRTLAAPGDVLIAMSGSGNSPNIVNALRTARGSGIHTAAILGYDGGHCLGICDIALHIPLHDMQVAEDIQVIIGHMLMRMLLEAGYE